MTQLSKNNDSAYRETQAIMNRQISAAIHAALAGALGLLLANSAATASGFSVPELSALGTGTSNAVVANPNETGAFSYNPSAMGFHDSSSIALGTVLINPKFDVTTASGNHDSENGDWFAAPIFQAAIKVNDQWRIGVGASAPFGLETRWKLGTFPALTGTARTLSLPAPVGQLDIPNGNHPTDSKLEIVAFTPTLAYRVNDELSLAAGLDYYKVREAKLNGSLAKIDGDGDALGWNASMLFRRNAWSFGLSYHSSVTVDVDGWYTPLDQGLVLLNTLLPGSGLPSSQSASLDLNLPWRLQLGVRYAVNDALAVELDWTRIGWSSFDTLDVVGSADGLITSDVNDWSDANAYRLGVTYDIRPTTQLRFGYAYDETGQDEKHFSARVPDNDRQLFSIGAAQDLGQGWALEASYMYVRVDERKIRSNVSYSTGDDVNGTDALDGEYNSSVNLVALEVRKSF